MTKKIEGVAFQAEESRRFGVLIDEAGRREQARKWVEADHAMLLLLCQQYGIKEHPTMFYELALALARERYPEPKKRGRKSKWTLLNQGMLVVEVERLVKPNDPSRGVDWACQQLAKREPWKSFLEKKSGTISAEPAEALRQVYYNSRDEGWTELSRDAFKFNEIQGEIEEWDNLVFDCVRNPYPK